MVVQLQIVIPRQPSGKPFFACMCFFVDLNNIAETILTQIFY